MNTLLKITLVLIAGGAACVILFKYQFSANRARPRDLARVSPTFDRTLAPTIEAAPVSSMLPKPESVSRAALWSDSAWHEARFNEAVIQVEARYGRFFRRLNWPPDRIERLKQQLARDQLTIMQAALAAPAGVFTPEQAAAQHEMLDRMIQANNASLHQTMGDADYAALDLFQRADTYRDTVGQIANSMRGKGLEVSLDTEDKLTEAYAEAMREVENSGLGDSITSNIGPDQRRRAFQLALLHNLSAVLPKQQLDSFLESEQELDSGS